MAFCIVLLFCDVSLLSSHPHYLFVSHIVPSSFCFVLFGWRLTEEEPIVHRFKLERRKTNNEVANSKYK